MYNIISLYRAPRMGPPEGKSIMIDTESQDRVNVIKK